MWAVLFLDSHFHFFSFLNNVCTVHTCQVSLCHREFVQQVRQFLMLFSQYCMLPLMKPSPLHIFFKHFTKIKLYPSILLKFRGCYFQKHHTITTSEINWPCILGIVRLLSRSTSNKIFYQIIKAKDQITWSHIGSFLYKY